MIRGALGRAGDHAATVGFLAVWTLLMVAAGAVLLAVEHLRRFRAWLGER